MRALRASGMGFDRIAVRDGARKGSLRDGVAGLYAKTSKNPGSNQAKSVQCRRNESKKYGSRDRLWWRVIGNE